MRPGRIWTSTSVATRVGMLIAILAGALWPTYLNLHSAYNNARLAELSHGPSWGLFYRALQKVDALFGSEHVLPGLFSGTPPAMKIFGVQFIDPLFASTMLLDEPTTALAIWPALLAVAITVALTGRGFCSFACPASLLFSFNLRLRERLETFFPRLRVLRRTLPDWLRYGVLLGGMLAAFLFGAWVWQLLLPYAMVSTALVNTVVGVPLGVTGSVLAFILLADLLLVPGEFCRAACPLGLVLGRASRLALLRIAADQRPCPSDCDSCVAACDLALDPSAGPMADCNLCGRCLPSCPTGKLAIRPRLPARRSRAAVFAVIIGLLLLVPAVGLAHHYRGLPHYGYFDNYPQVPIEEYIAGEGRFEMNFTLYNFQGMQKVDVDQPDDLQIFLVVFDLQQKKPLGGTAEITIRADGEVVQRWNRQAEQESIFFLHTKVPQSGDLALEISFPDPAGGEVFLSSPFDLPGEGGHNPLAWVGAALVVLTVVVIFASKQARPTRRGRTTK